MILRSSGPSPFGRKVKIVAKMLGIYDQLTVEDSNTNDPADTLRQQNPLGKIPILILEDGRKIFDSRVICEYLDAQVDGTSLHPTESDARWEALTLQALGDGIVDASILQVYENRMRPEEKRHGDWLSYQADKVKRSLDHLSANAPSLEGDLTIGHVAIACALGYLDLRFEGKWRESYPTLVAWLETFDARVPAFEATKFVA
ncbi:MAG: glutathione S-transferase family protein [Thalassospira sp.]|uniref:glutathione S-transferase family protein n=1 Tax=Thalassospira sp. TaxID=1912094 RepID=UPI001B206BBD|nr:glutathione S-transferase family protein [Thalassospira sp.]MBO6577733.1 glutathione S-transferase family protein [Thalassospira sp.]MBO6818609.1 glutathione S-transferase family protein [Thalassospira sp.]MBO6887473.1 glutathione S-transferase family protein [Thalassospira sp.]